MTLTTQPYLAVRLKKEYRYTCTPPLCLHGRLLGEIYILPSDWKEFVNVGDVEGSDIGCFNVGQLK
jgi:hypothetical protein